MFGDLLQCEQLGAAQAGALFTGAADAQRLDDVPQGVERLAHGGQFHGIVRRRLSGSRIRATARRCSGAPAPRDDWRDGVRAGISVILIIWDCIHRE